MINRDNLFIRDVAITTDMELVGRSGLSVDSTFIPVFAGLYGTMVNFAGYTEKAVIYNLFTVRYNTLLRRMSEFQNLEESIMLYKTMTMRPPSRTTVLPVYYTNKGCIFTMDAQRNPTILFVLAIQKDYFFSLDKSNPDYSKFVILVKKSFLEPLHKYVYSRLKGFIADSGIDVLYTDDVEQYCFGNNFVLPNFATIQERVAYLSNVRNFI